MRGELDWIVMKALEKDRRRRYETANDFAADVMRYLTDQPVEACPPSARYRLHKFARRNKATVVSVLSLVTLLSLGIVGTSFGLARALRAERKATAAAKAEADQRQRADNERQRAEVNFQKARQAVDQMLTRTGRRQIEEHPPDGASP